MKLPGLIAIAMFAAAGAHAGQAPAGPERFELTSIKAVRPTLINTIVAEVTKEARSAK